MSRRFVTEAPRPCPESTGVLFPATVRMFLAWTLVTGLLVLTAAGAASAFSQPRLGGVSRSVTATGDSFFLVLTKQTKTSHTCQKTSKEHNTVRQGQAHPDRLRAAAAHEPLPETRSPRRRPPTRSDRPNAPTVNTFLSPGSPESTPGGFSARPAILCGHGDRDSCREPANPGAGTARKRDGQDDRLAAGAVARAEADDPVRDRRRHPLRAVDLPVAPSLPPLGSREVAPRHLRFLHRLPRRARHPHPEADPVAEPLRHDRPVAARGRHRQPAAPVDLDLGVQVGEAASWS